MQTSADTFIMSLNLLFKKEYGFMLDVSITFPLAVYVETPNIKIGPNTRTTTYRH